MAAIPIALFMAFFSAETVVVERALVRSTALYTLLYTYLLSMSNVQVRLHNFQGLSNVQVSARSSVELPSDQTRELLK